MLLQRSVVIRAHFSRIFLSMYHIWILYKRCMYTDKYILRAYPVHQRHSGRILTDYLSANLYWLGIDVRRTRRHSLVFLLKLRFYIPGLLTVFFFSSRIADLITEARFCNFRVGPSPCLLDVNITVIIYMLITFWALQSFL